MAAIEKLNQEDIDATQAQDPKRLIEGWAEDAVAYFPGSPRAAGKQAIWKIYSQSPPMKVLSYTSKYKNLQVDGVLACEWFEKKAEYKLSPESPPISWHANGPLVLKPRTSLRWAGMLKAIVGGQSG